LGEKCSPAREKTTTKTFVLFPAQRCQLVAVERHRSTAGDLLESARQRALLLHFKEANCDDFLNSRACQLRRLVIQRVAMLRCRILLNRVDRTVVTGVLVVN
jgi:hypothetical protein